MHECCGRVYGDFVYTHAYELVVQLYRMCTVHCGAVGQGIDKENQCKQTNYACS